MNDIPTTPTKRQIALRRLSGEIRRKYSQRDVNAAVEALWGTSLTCLDGGCIFGHPGGMHTNGGCQHTKCDLLTNLLMLRYLAQELDVEVPDEP